ncbi:hypothetical protein ACEWY4_019992 [Coilia grayii]|uniref:VWFD domain-containing protein n=1 Tax=Coilia grayii TaxID=363190 RepID=A0ABD1JCI8_9TELE
MAVENTATVYVWSPDFTKKLTVPKGNTITIELPVAGSTNRIVRITSDTDITVVSSKWSLANRDGSVILPTSQLGTDYVVFTPRPLLYAPSAAALVTIVNSGKDNEVQILPARWMTISGGTWTWRNKKEITLKLKPYDVYPLQSSTIFTSTKIKSTYPLAVLAGASCTSYSYGCVDVYEQLMPVQMLSNYYLVPAMHKRRNKKDEVHVVAHADNTLVSFFDGKHQNKYRLRTGESKSILIPKATCLAVTSNKKVMVMYFRSNLPYEEFLTNILPTSDMSNMWMLNFPTEGAGRAVIVAETKGSNTIRGVTRWTPFLPDTRYVWTTERLGKPKSPVIIYGKALMAANMFGKKAKSSYGKAPTPPPDPCDSIACREKEECRKGVCVPTSQDTCSALGDPHYRTFDGRRYDFQGTCTYTMAEVVKTQTGLVPFTVLAKNNHRGNRWVSFVRTMTVTVYNHIVAISNRRGQVEVDGEIVYLPVSLAGGKLEVVQRGRNAILKTDFGLEVTYDWNMMLYITVPSSYFRTLGGLCGNYNGDREDEWTSPTGSRLSSALEFAKSWKVTDGDLFCHDDCRGRCPSCSPSQQEKFGGKEYCGLITDTNGVFAACISKVDPEMYFNNCVFDICINNGITSFLCDNVENYVDACMAQGINIHRWRSVADCPINCPANSHYEACGPACAASCAEKNAADTCKQPCVEGCQCNEGFVLSGNTCVPVTSCGCTHEGRYYPPETTFWADNTCTKKCTCKSGSIQCASTKCKSSEVCSVKNGVRDCHPLSYGTCYGSGDPHYRSFDGNRFDFQGTCTYYLSKLMTTTDQTLEAFEVQVQNENRGRNKAVSYTKTALIKVYGHTIVLSSDNPERVMLDDVFVNLPITLEDGRLSVVRRGWVGVVKTEVGLQVQYDWRSYVSLTLPGTYSGEVGGLCGNFNGNGNDDMRTPDNTPATTPTEFGKSWKVKDDPRCKDTCQNCPVCDINSDPNKPYREACSILTKQTGPFKGCHSKVNPQPYFEDCVYDVCMYHGHSSPLCDALSAYTAVCQEAKASISVWRTETFCPLACTAYSHYELCAYSCSQTCGTNEVCDVTSCKEGCECDDGFELSSGQCVREEQCGCLYEDRYYLHGQVFFPGKQCERRCECGDNGRVQCKDNFSCGPNEVCKIQDGAKGCFPKNKATCSVSGSGHYQTFDNRVFSVSGNCMYKMAEVVEDKEGKRVPFSVVIHQDSAPNDPTVTRSVQIQVNDHTLTMLPGRQWEVTVDRVRVYLPFILDNGELRAYQSSLFITLQTDFGLKVTYDTISMVRVEMPSSYQSTLLGLCGNYNSHPDDDFMLPGGDQAPSAEAFAKGWVVVQEGVKCQTGCGSQCPSTPPDTQRSIEKCDILKDKEGPFSKCHATVPPQEYFENCVKDLSEQVEKEDVLCQHLQNYVAICQEAGALVDLWRNETFCPKTCPENSQYELCADTCTTTCASLTTSPKCSHCQEGCECMDGFAFDGGACRPLGKCGCLVDGVYFKSGETVVTGEDCMEKCTCVDGVFSCEKTGCTEKQVCAIREGVKNCYEVDPCEQKGCREKERCVKSGTDVLCVAESKASCWAIGDPYYRTFDGNIFSFQGTCSYTLVQTNGKDDTLTPFSIVTKTELESLHRGAYLKTATIRMEDVNIVIVYGDPGKVMVDGSTHNLPLALKSGKIQISQKTYQGFIKTDFGVEIIFDWGEDLNVTVSSSYYNNLEGMCGTYNGDQTDDFSLPSGTSFTSIAKWAEAWSFPETNKTCLHACHGECPGCSTVGGVDMDTKPLLLCLTAVLATVNGCPDGLEFLTTFLKNYEPSSETKHELIITAYENPAIVNVLSPSYNKKVTVDKGMTIRLHLPDTVELDGEGVSNRVVRITSNNYITVTTSNRKRYTGDSCVILPTPQLGREYVVFTPGPEPLKALYAIVNGDKVNVVEVLPADKGKQKTTHTLQPYQAFQFQDTRSLTGTRLKSTHPIAVLAGAQCTRLTLACDHVYEQLIPVESLSNYYLVPSMVREISDTDYAYAVATEDHTTVTIAHERGSRDFQLAAGEYKTIEMKRDETCVVMSNKKVMVMYFGSNRPYDVYLTTILPTSELSNSWSFIFEPLYDNYAVIISEAKGLKTMQGLSVNWTPFLADQRYVWTLKRFTSSDPFAISGSALMAVYIFGGLQYNGYGATGVCSSGKAPTPPPDPCNSITCREKEECRKGVCVPTSQDTCSALGDPHYRTFDGRRYDFQGTCTYTMAEVVKTQTGLVPFTVLAKNNHRGNRWVSFVRTVTVTVYSHTVAISSRMGQVEVGGEIVYLPVSLAGGKLKVVQRGRNAILKTDFGLEVTYDWNMMLYITVPSSYFRTLGGLCGNYNGDREDEWTSPTGSRLSSALDFATSWKVTDGDLFCHDDCRGRCPSCSPSQQEKFGGKEYCGLITDTNGVFAACRSKVDPEMYFNNCVFDICINNGITTFLCDNVQNYVDACMAQGIMIDRWRSVADCPINCPANSHYEACAPACAASCAEKNAADTCKQPCVEGCQCNKGFVLSGDTCVPVTSCGCTYEGRYYPPETTFWADNTCTKKCKCKSGSIQCTSTKCKSSEVCSVKNGVRDCHPLSYGTCYGSGDPHYQSFDGKRFDFQGTCTYYLSKLMTTTDQTLEAFEVQVQNENRGRNKAVSYTKTVLIKVYGHTIVLSSDNPGRVKLDDVFVNLPITLENGQLSIVQRGGFGVVKTEFGLQVQYDWRSYVSLTLPGTYSGEVGGLCGNFNGNGNDDMRTPDNTSATTPTEFGKSWKVKDDPRCKDTCQNCPVCDINSDPNKPYREACSILTKQTGPFKDCHSKVNPQPYFEDCVYDVCMYHGHSSPLCNALSAYTAVCQEAKASISVWRTEIFCPLACKANSHYKLCTYSCSQTCGTNEVCDVTSCKEGCECDDGFEFSSGQCVREEQCGCLYEGRYYLHGQVFFPGKQCERRCECGDNGRVQCQGNFSCGPNEVCKIQDGTKGCFPENKATCSVSGTGHYQTFDNRVFSVPGNCTYKMVEVVQDKEGKRVPFNVVIHQDSVPNDPTVTRSVQVQVSDHTLMMLPGRQWEVMVDGVRVYLPLVLDDGKVRAYQSGLVITLQTDFGLKVTYDTISMVRVEMPSSYQSTLLGLCGNYNSNPVDDFVLPGGDQAPSAEAFAKGWVVVQEGVKCQTGCGSQCPSTPPDTQTSIEKCDILKDKKGPFSKCHATVPPQKYFENCVKDLSEQGGKEDVLCQHLQNYVAICQEAGASVDLWRNKTFCPKTCPENSQYELCADTCTTTCASLTTSPKCSHCQEGCECTDGFAFDGGACRPLGKCGCLVDGVYLKSGETVVTGEDCMKKCTCVDGVFSCEKTGCTEKQVCAIREGVKNCYEVDPCEQKGCREKERCVKSGTDVLCVAESKASCWAIGDPYYRTFDGNIFSFQGTCSYTLVQTNGKDDTLTRFSIVTKTKLESLHRGAYLKTATIRMEDVNIVIVYGDPGKVMINGSPRNLPVTLKAGKINITQKTYQGFIETDFGVEIIFDWGEDLNVTVSSSYFNNLEGMCGTYNNDPADDFSLPRGDISNNLTKFVEAWSRPETNQTCLHACHGKCPNCPEQSVYTERKYCGELQEKDGAFAACHARVSPVALLADCIYNMCNHPLDKYILCKVMANYINICQQNGAKVSPQWFQTLNCLN